MQKKKHGGIAAIIFSFSALLFTVFYVVPNTPGIINALIGGFEGMPGQKSGFYAVSVQNTGVTSTELHTAEMLTEPVTEVQTTESETQQTAQSIIEIQSAYKELYKNSEVAGTVKELFYDTNAATFTQNSVAVRNTTSLTPDFGKMLKNGSDFTAEDIKKPLVLIFHTHTTESYLLSDSGVYYSGYKTRSTLPDRNMVRVGNEICTELTNSGIGVIHDTTIYDSAYNGAYARSREGIEKILEQYPTIQIVLDIHRDAIKLEENVMGKPTAQINGKKAAQIMIITGAEDGGITGFESWEQNLAFALEIQNTAQQKFKGLMRPLYFCPRKYNMDITPCSLLLEIGSDANTLEEAVYSGSLIGKALADIVIEHSKQA